MSIEEGGHASPLRPLHAPIARIWRRYGADMARIWRGYGADMARIWRRGGLRGDMRPPSSYRAVHLVTPKHFLKSLNLRA